MQEQHGAHVPSQFTQTGIDAGMADTNLDSLEAYKKATEGQGGTYGRGNFMLNPQHEDITTCVICGRDIDSHSNPNTDYRGMRGDAPPTDHYFLGGDQGGSDDKYDFESRKAGEGDDDYIDINEPFGSTRPIKKQEQDPEGYKKEWADVQEGGPGSGRKPEGGSNLSNSHKSALDKYIKQYGKDDQGSIHSIAGWGRDTHLPANILKQVKDASDDDILDYVRSKASEIELPDELRDPWGYDFDGYDKDGFSSGYPNADPLLRIMHKTGTPWDEDAMNSMDRFIQNAEDEVYDYVKSNPNSSEWDINISTGIVSWVTSDGDDGTYNWYISVTDGYDGTDQYNFTVTVNNTYHAVTFSNESVSPVNVLQGATSTITIDVVSPNATIDIVYVSLLILWNR